MTLLEWSSLLEELAKIVRLVSLIPILIVIVTGGDLNLFAKEAGKIKNVLGELRGIIKNVKSIETDNIINMSPPTDNDSDNEVEENDDD